MLVATIAVAPLLLSLSSVDGVASTKNANIDGTWSIASSDGNGEMTVTNENVSTGSFGGSLGGSGVSFRIVAGLVTGVNFTMTIEVAGTVVNEHGEQVEYRGVVSGNKMTITSTGAQAWDNGKPVQNVDRPGTYVGTREGVTLSGVVDFGCSQSACSATSGPLYNATVEIDGPTPVSTTTDNEGKWSATVIPGDYTVTPSAPGVTFDPDSYDLHVTKSMSVQDFSGCTSESSGIDAPTAKIRASVSASSSLLIGDYCASLYAVDYSPSLHTAAVTWVAVAYLCNPTGRYFFNLDLSRRIFFDTRVTPGSSQGTISTLASGATQINVDDMGQLVLEFTIKPGGKTATVTTHSNVYRQSLTTGICQPIQSNDARLPFKLKRKLTPTQ
jgi:hypothetical protein